MLELLECFEKSVGLHEMERTEDERYWVKVSIPAKVPECQYW